MYEPGRIRVGARVEILQPDYAAGQVGVILGQEEVIEGGDSDRWLIRVTTQNVMENMVLSLVSDEFRLLDPN